MMKDNNNNNDDDDDDQMLLLAKIRVLLQHSHSSSVYNEQRLVALTLLTRTERAGLLLDDTADDEAIWDDAVLLEFTQNLIRSHSSRPPPPLLHVRLVAQLLHRMLPADHDDDDDTTTTTTKHITTTTARRRRQQQQQRVMNGLGEALLQCFCSDARSGWCDSSDDEEESVVLCEVLISLNEWLKQRFHNNADDDHDRLDAILQQIWRAAARLLQQTRNHTSKNNQESAGGGSEVEEQEDNDESAAQQLMDQTLTALLDQTRLVNVATTSSTDTTTGTMPPDLQLQLELTNLWLHHGVRLAKQRKKLPSVWRPLLSQWLQRSSSTPASAKPTSSSSSTKEYNRYAAQLREKQAEVLLLILQTYCAAQQQQPTDNATILWTNDDDTNNMAADVTQLILACVVSVDPQQDELRVLAWMTVTTLVRSSSTAWEWLFSQRQQSSNKLGALVRLAAGEWKIQLATLLNQTDEDGAGAGASSKTTGIYNGDDSSPSFLLVEVCAQFLLLTVDYLLQLSDRMDDDSDDNTANIPSGDVILHVRKSLDEALNSAVQYLGLMKVRIPAVDSAVVRVLAKLLTEFDVFAPAPVALRMQQQQPPKDGDDGSPECAALQGLHVAMEIATNTTMNDDDGLHLSDCLLPSIAAVLASAEGEPSRVSLLKEYGLLGDHLYNFLERFWQSDGASDAVSVSWACQVSELWVSVDRICETSRIQAVLVKCLQRMLKEALSPEIVDALSTVVGCYVTLQGDDPPGESDATILQQVLQACAHHQEKE